MTRRGLIAGGTAVAAGATLGRTGRAAAQAAARVDVAVIGAGLAGLVAARDLVARGRSVVVLEARDRVGGRTLNAPVARGEVAELGGQWVGPTQDRVLALARSLGVGRFDSYAKGNALYLRGSTRIVYPEDGPTGTAPPDPAALGDLARVVPIIDGLAAKMPRDAPWNHPQAAELDRQTADSWVRSQAESDAGRFLFEVFVKNTYDAEPGEVSMLNVLWRIASAGNERTPGSILRMYQTRGGAQQWRLRGGSQELSLRLARRLGRRVRLEAPVRRVVQGPSRVRVEHDGGAVLARKVVCAVPPILAVDIDWSPDLPALKRQFLSRMNPGTEFKVLHVYERPYWRADGWAGEAITDREPGLLTFDNSPPDGRPGVMLSFIKGSGARRWQTRSPSARQRAVRENLVEFYGRPDLARRPLRVFEKDWNSDPWSRGAAEGYTAPGVLTQYPDQLVPRFRDVHWAGTETSGIWNGYMEGAVRSGERAAKEVLDAL